MSPTRWWAWALGWLLLGTLAQGAGNSDPSAAAQRQGHSAILLRDGTVLVVGGTDALGGGVASVERFVPWSGWELLGASSNQPRLSSASGLLLHDGRVLLVGGGTHLYDPAASRWLDAGSAGLLQPDRTGHTLSLLGDGTVLLVGGAGYGDAGQPQPLLGRAPPDGGVWEWTQVVDGAAAALRHRHTATLLGDGTVLLFGGSQPGGTPGTSSPLALFDPAAGAFRPLDAGFATNRSSHSASRRHSGDLVIVGDSQPNSPAVFLRNIGGVWLLLNPMPMPLAWSAAAGHSAVVAPNQDFLAFGGCAYLPCSPLPRQGTAVLYKPTSTVAWEPVPPLDAGRGMHTSTLLMDGKVLVVGGTLAGSPSWELLDPVGFGFFQADADGGSFARPGATLSPLPSGEALLVGGQSPPATQALARVSSGGSYAEVSSKLPPRVGHTATLVTSHEVLVLGGVAPTGEVLGDCWLVAIDTGSAKPCRPMPAPRALHTATLLSDGRVLVAGGLRPLDLQPRNEAAIFTPGPLGGTWSPTFSLRAARAAHAAVLLPSGRVLLTGGEGAAGRSESVDPSGPNSDEGPQLAEARRFHTATLLRDGRVLLSGGEDESKNPSATLEVLGFDGGFAHAAGGPMPEARPRPAAVALPTGEVVIAGGPKGDGGSSVSRWSPRTDGFTGTAWLQTPRVHPGVVVANQGDVVVGGGTGSPAPFELHRTFAGTRTWMAHGLIANTAVVPSSNGLFKFTLAGDWREATEASTGGAQSSPVNLPRLVFQRLDNGQVFTPAYSFDAKAGELWGLAPDLPHGHYRAWAYVSGLPGGAAWFRVGARATSAWDAGVLPFEDAGTADGGGLDAGSPDGGGSFALAVALDGGDPRLVGARLTVRVAVTAPPGDRGDQLTLKLTPSAELAVCDDTGCPKGVRTALSLAGALDAQGQAAMDVAISPAAEGPHTLWVSLKQGDVEVAAESVSLEAVAVSFQVGVCSCSASPASWGAALLALWVFGRRRPKGC